jgi:uncharacterized protein (TIGR03118 family)
MKITTPYLAASALLLAVAPEDCAITELPGQQDGADDDGATDEEPGEEVGAFYEVENLVSDQEGLARTTDPNLVNPWGLAFGPETFFWVANQGTSTATLYDGEGNIQSGVIGGPVELPLLSVDHQGVKCPAEGAGGPTGEVFYGGDGFQVEEGAASRFIFATLEGTLIGWSPDSTNPRTGVIVVDNFDQGAVYTGLAIASMQVTTEEEETLTMSRIYAANFAGGMVEVYDEAWNPVVLGPDAFIDSGLPAGYSPFGIQEIDGTLYVAYAVVDPATGEAAPGLGNGIVSAFDINGTFQARVSTGGMLDAPWGMAMAPDSFGEFGGALLVGNFGDGHITALHAETYEQLGQLELEEGVPIEIEGLWAIAFGNDMMAGDSEDLYFTAGIEDEMHGLFGEIEPMEDDDDCPDDDDDDKDDDDKDDDDKDDDHDDDDDKDDDDKDDDDKDDDDKDDDHDDDGKDDDHDKD